MASQSPQRTRKPLQQSGVASTAQANVRREPSPSPSIRERQRYNRTMSMPIVPAAAQAQPSPSTQQAQIQKQRRSPSHERLYENQSADCEQNDDDRAVEPETPKSPPAPPPPQHSQSYSQPLQQQSQNQSNNPFYPRPARASGPPPVSNLAVDDGKWEMSEELMADIQRADLLMHHQQQQQLGLPPAPGTEGVAYAGGAVTAVIGRFSASSPPKQSDKNLGNPKVDEPAHTNGGSVRRQTVTQAQAPGSMQGQMQSPITHAMQGREWERGRDVVANVAPAIVSSATLPRAQQHTGSRPLTPDNGSHTSPNAYYNQTKAATPPISRKTANTSPTYPNMSSPMRALKNRTPDRSLPVQEEPDEHDQSPEHVNMQHTGVSPIPPSELGQPDRDWERNTRNGGNKIDEFDDHDDNEGTLIDTANEVRRQSSSGGDETEEANHTPRSPSAALFDEARAPPQGAAMRGIHGVLLNEADEKSSKGHMRNGSYGSYGSQTTAHTQNFNPAAFQDTMKKLQSNANDNTLNNNMQNGNAERNIRQLYPPQALYSRNESRGSYPNWIPDFYQNYQDEYEQFDENAYYQQQLAALQGGQPRPRAPEPPSAHSQTNAPSLINGNNNDGPHEPIPRSVIPPFSPAPPGGTPYPYPFSHLRRGYAYPSHPTVPRVTSSLYDPSVVQEQMGQLALQMQMYALNNGGGMSDSTFSPASTPYPGAGPMYSPFNAYWNQTRGAGRGQARPDANGEANDNGGRVTSASIRSSPSHMPVSLPLPPLRGRGLKKRDRFANLRGTTVRNRVQPPPRVESTQPRDTSPEPSSGEETAGEKFEISPNAGGQEWEGSRDSVDEENGEWIDEDSDDEHDLLDLEFHPTYVSNIARRRKRWDQRWDDMVRAFQALDRETDATLVLLASPSHTNTLHSLSSRSIRRDASLFDAHAMNDIRNSFGQIASQRRSARTSRPSLVERLYSSSSGGEASPSSTGSREEDLRRALKTAIESLNAMRKMYEVREGRWREEERRLAEEREGMELLMRQTLGTGFVEPPGTHAHAG